VTTIEALIALHRACPGILGCNDFHHGKSDRHSPGDPCPPLQRYFAAYRDAGEVINRMMNQVKVP
jgi:hypothetical protein